MSTSICERRKSHVASLAIVADYELHERGELSEKRFEEIKRSFATSEHPADEEFILAIPLDLYSRSSSAATRTTASAADAARRTRRLPA